MQAWAPAGEGAMRRARLASDLAADLPRVVVHLQKVLGGGIVALGEACARGCAVGWPSGLPRAAQTRARAAGGAARGRRHAARRREQDLRCAAVLGPWEGVRCALRLSLIPNRAPHGVTPIS